MRAVLQRVKSAKPVIWFLLISIAAFGLISGRFFTASNFNNLLQQSAALTVLAFGQTLIILTQGTDLSMGSQVSFCTIAFVLMALGGIPLWLCAILVALCTIVIGAVNSLMISILRVPVFISTFGMQYILRSVSLILCDGNSIYYSSDFFYQISSRSFLGLPVVTWVAIAAFVLTWVMLNRTRLGANIIALGGNVEALKVAGVNATIVRMQAWMFAGFLTGIAGLLVLCRVESGQPAVGDGMEFHSIAAVLLGGTSMREGKGGVLGTVFGVWLIYALRNGLNLSGLSSMYHNAILGTVILLAIVVDAVIGRAGKREV